MQLFNLQIVTLGLCNYFFLFIFPLVGALPTFGDAVKQFESNSSQQMKSIIRVIKPGIFDYQSNEYLIRMRAWGVGFPARDQPGFNEAINFTETKLLNASVRMKVKSAFDAQNLKVVDVLIGEDQTSFSQEAITQGIGWHLEKETNRHGVFIISQIKAKRKNLGVWKHENAYNQQELQPSIPVPMLRSMIGQNPFSASIQYWVTTFGKVHRPECTFYERGRGEHSRRPTGKDCRICGGARNSK
jgi:hypothetical protein